MYVSLLGLENYPSKSVVNAFGRKENNGVGVHWQFFSSDAVLYKAKVNGSGKSDFGIMAFFGLGLAAFGLGCISGMRKLSAMMAISSLGAFAVAYKVVDASGTSIPSDRVGQEVSSESFISGHTLSSLSIGFQRQEVRFYEDDLAKKDGGLVFSL